MSEMNTFQFADLAENQYMIVNDTVMGGRSSSRFKINEGSARYSGSVSLDNNGGFASVRMLWPYTVEQSEGQTLVQLTVKGDGLLYQFRLRTNKGFDGAAYVQSFETVKDQQLTVQLKVDDFVPQFRGRVLTGMPALKLNEVQQMGILIADKQQGDFSIELKSLAIK